jgi:isoleucyl-tRNA synthetase
MLLDKDGNKQPMVDRTGKFFKLEDLDPEFVSNNVNISLYKEYAGRYVKNEYISAFEPEKEINKKLSEEKAEDSTLDIDLCVMLKQQGLVFKIEKYIHSYPHCWRTDKPVL